MAALVCLHAALVGLRDASAMLQVMRLEDFGTKGTELKGIFYLRDVADADKLIEAFSGAKEKGGKVVCVGGGYGCACEDSWRPSLPAPGVP
jgi:hypothetical protein